MPDRQAARLILVTQQSLSRLDSTRSRRAPTNRERLTVPRRRLERRPTPAWSPRAIAEHRPMRRMRCTLEYWDPE